MSFSFGGATIVDMEYTRSWGLSPASARITAVGGYFVFVGGDASLSLGGESFNGILSRIVDQTQDGTRTTMEFVDNRVKLMWDEVYGLFNRVEVRSDNPTTPGIDRQKRYVHILPENWDQQLKTYTDEPMSAQDIIASVFSAPTISYPWSANFHASQNDSIGEIDALTGKKLGNVLQEISERQGLVFTLDEEYTLRWARKGEDQAPDFDDAIASEYSLGEAVSAVDTEVAIVGDRNRYQDIGIELEPDWKDDYENFWNEPDWLQEVADTFGPAGDDFASKAELAAKARKVTVRQYVAEKGDDSLADYGMWGEVSRMEIPVWTYLHDIVFKAFRVPLDYSFNGIPLESLDLVEGLLCSVDSTLDGAMSYNVDSGNGGGYYPDAKAFIIVKGQQLSLLDPTKQRVISEAELTRAGTEFAPNNRFNLDTRNKTIIFEDPVFIPNDLFLFPNNVTDAPDSLKAIAVPNADVDLEEATVRASLVWDAERYRKVFGSGERKGSQYAADLARHKLFSNESDQGEIPFADGKFADDKAQELADSLISQEQRYASGGFKINGSYGTELNGSVDRVTTRLTFDGGISETVEYTKERGQSNFENERELERKQRSRDLFPGQRNLRDDVKNLELIATVTKELKRSPLEPVYGSLASVMEKPVGASDCSVSKVYDPSGDSWDAGWPVFIGPDGRPNDNGKTFAGIVIPQGASDLLPLATQGIVPVSVEGPFNTDDNVGLDFPTDDTPDPDPTVDGKRHIGRIVSQAYSGGDTILALVQLGASVPKTGNEYSFELLDASDVDGPKALVTDGEFNDRLPPGMGENDFILDLPNNDEADPDTNGENDIYLEVTYDFDGTITSLSITAVSPDNLPEGTPGNLIIKLGYALVHKSYDSLGTPTYSVTVHNTVCGDIRVDLVPPQVYAFQMFDASDDEGSKVIIYDGKVNGIHGDDHVPQGMGGDDYVLPVQDDWEVWLDIPYDPATFGIIDPVTINAGDETPSDTIIGEVGHSYVQIGYVGLKPLDPELPAPDVRTVIPHNTLCGDYDFKKPEDTNTYSFKMLSASDGSTGKVRILDGDVIDEEGESHTPDGMGHDQVVKAVNDGDSIYLSIFYNRATRQIVEPITIGVGDVPDDTEGMAAVEIGYVNVNFDTDGNAVVTPHNTICGDYFFLIDDKPLYSFQIFDASETSPPGGPTYKVRIVDGDVIDRDGNEFTPTGMGDDAFTVEVGDGDEIWLEIPRDEFWNVVGRVIINHGDSVPDDTDDVKYVPIGYVNLAGDGTLEVHNSQCGDYHFAPPPDANRYSFEILDRSDSDGTKVLIMDGLVYGPNDNGTLPEGMGADDYIMDVFDGAEIYLIITVDNNSSDVTSVTIGIAQSTPDDTKSEAQSVFYVTIGSVAVNYSGAIPVVNPTNDLCGDYVLNLGLQVTGQDDEGHDTSFVDVDKLNFYGAVTVEHDDTDSDSTDVDIHIGLDVTGDDDEGGRTTVDKAEVMNFYGGVDIGLNDDDPQVIAVDVEIGLDVTGDDDEGGRNSVKKAAVMNFYGGVDIGANDDDPDVAAVDVEIGLDVTGDDDEGGRTSVKKAAVMNFYGGVDIGANDDDPDVDAVDVEIGLDVTGEDADGGAISAQKVAVMNFIGAVSISSNDDDEVSSVDVTIGSDISDDEGNEVDGVKRINVIRGDMPDDDDPDHLIVDLGDGVAELHLPTIDAGDDDGNEVDEITRLSFTYGRPDDENLIVEDNGNGDALIHISKLDVIDTEGGDSIRLAAQLTFHHDRPDTEGVIVEEGDDGEARVYIPDLTVTDDDGNEGDGIEAIEFIGYAETVVDDDGEGGVTVQILPEPEEGESEGIPNALITDGSGVSWGPAVDFDSDDVQNAIKDIIYQFIQDGGIDDLLEDGRLDGVIDSWMIENFKIEDFAQFVEVDVCVDGELDTITLLGPLDA